jgi:WGR domain
MVREFHYLKDSSAKFWRVERAGGVLTIQYGRLGSPGRTQVKDLGSDAAAADHLVHSLSTPEQLGQVIDRGGLPYAITTTLCATLLDGVGVVCVAPVLQWFDRCKRDDGEHKRLYTLLSHIPTDEAFIALLDRLDQPHAKALTAKAMKRYPVRVLRLLPPVAVGDSAAALIAAELLPEHVSAHRRYVPAALPTLQPAARDLLITLAGPA